MRRALDSAGLAPRDIAAVCRDPAGLAVHAHAEAIAMREVLGETIACAAITPRAGHLLSAALPLELARTLLHGGDAPRILCNAWGPPGQFLSLVIERAAEPR